MNPSVFFFVHDVCRLRQWLLFCTRFVVVHRRIFVCGYGLFLIIWEWRTGFLVPAVVATHMHPESIASSCKGSFPFRCQCLPPPLGDCELLCTVMVEGVEVCSAPESRPPVRHDPEHKESPVGEAVQRSLMLRKLYCRRVLLPKLVLKYFSIVSSTVFPFRNLEFIESWVKRTVRGSTLRYRAYGRVSCVLHSLCLS